MSRVCQITKKRPITGNNVSHSNVKTKRRFLPNLQKRRLWDEENGRFVTLRLTTRALRTINKKGLAAVLDQLKKQTTTA